jgi:hypothetical protein
MQRNLVGPCLPLYARVDERQFVIPAIGPDAAVDGSGFKSAVKRAQARAKDDYGLDIELVAEQELADAEFRDEWERLSVARAVAATVIAYRADRNLSPRDLAGLLDIPQPQVARFTAAGAQRHPARQARGRRRATLVG